MREEVKNWFLQAQKDLKASKNSLKSGDFEWASFQAHQAAEKALKAYYIFKKKKPFLGHNLIKLGKELNLKEKFLEILQDLNPDYTLSRYPDAANGLPFEIYSYEKAKTKIANVEEILKWIEKRFRK